MFVCVFHFGQYYIIQFGGTLDKNFTQNWSLAVSCDTYHLISSSSRISKHFSFIYQTYHQLANVCPLDFIWLPNLYIGTLFFSALFCDIKLLSKVNMENMCAIGNGLHLFRTRNESQLNWTERTMTRNIVLELVNRSINTTVQKRGKNQWNLCKNVEKETQKGKKSV